MTTTSPTEVDTGTGYGRPPSSHNARLTEVGPGTPMGEALRRYWQPVANSSALTSDVPHRTKLLGEDLIVFRDGQGRAGVVFERCAHRGSSLFYGRIEDDGIRCCYHGWKFDVQGHCLEQACEPGLGKRREAARQPWYPVEERYGLVFVYMGPPDRKPALPRYEFFEDLEEGEVLYNEPPIPGMNVTGPITECNWLQSYENAVDPVHAPWLHYTHSGQQFAGVGEPGGFPVEYFDPNTAPQKIEYSRTDNGVMYTQRFDFEESDGKVYELDWAVELQVPNIIGLPDFTQPVRDRKHDCLIWMVPADNTSFRFFLAIRASDPARFFNVLVGIKQNGKMPWELSEEEMQRYPGDNEAQISQGPITQHSEETLATSDKGIVMLRRMLNQIVDDVETGRDPMNIEHGDASPRGCRSGVFTLREKSTSTESSAVNAP